MHRSMAIWVLTLSLAALPMRAGSFQGKAETLRADDANKPAPAVQNQPLKLPGWWKKGDPLPIEKSNCVRCHLTAGRELTLPVRDFARSIHDLAKLTCNKCHGGDTKNDATAHEADHGFIGTKLSAHMAACIGCHTRETLGFKKGKHYWDLSKSINKKYPVCIDCHGNHDVGKPPADFSLTTVCIDCHKEFAKDLPQAAAVVAENDLLWKTLRDVQARNKDAANPIPEQFQRERDRVRSLTSRLIHRAGPITPQETQEVNDRARKLRAELEVWLKKQK
ncbi:MAG TPA: cytochrome c3 family protein [Gemmataceae bacterium]|nr:cytochrome c3 family protein [Gemmataceae bacterium]